MIEAWFSGAVMTVQRLATEAALARVRAKLAELERHEPPAELPFSMSDKWSRHLFIALCRRYGLRPLSLSPTETDDSHGSCASLLPRRGVVARVLRSRCRS